MYTMMFTSNRSDDVVQQAAARLRIVVVHDDGCWQYAALQLKQLSRPLPGCVDVVHDWLSRILPGHEHRSDDGS